MISFCFFPRPHPLFSQLIGLASFANDGMVPHQEEQTRAFVDGIRAVERYRTAPIVMMVEAQPGQEAANIYSHVADYPNLLFMREASGGRPGVPIDGNIKLGLVYGGQALLSRRALTIAQNLVALTNHTHMKIRDKEYTDPQTYLISLLAFQMGNFHLRVTLSRDGLTESIHPTGKLHNTNDDLAVAFLMLWYWPQVFWVSSKREEYWVMKQRILAELRTRGLQIRRH